MNIHISTLKNMADAASLANEAPVLWVPSERLSVQHVETPAAPPRKWEELMPWLLEDRLLEDVTSLHFVIAGKNSDRTLSVLVTARAQMEAWNAEAENAGLNQYSLVPDYFALPWQEGIITAASKTVTVENGEKNGEKAELMLVRSGPFEGFAAPPQMAWRLMEKMLRKPEAGLGDYFEGRSEGKAEDKFEKSIATGSENKRRAGKKTLLILGIPPGQIPESLRGQVEIRNSGIDWQRSPRPEGVNLLSGDYRLPQHGGDLRQWRSSAALLALAVVVSFAWLWLGNQRLEGDVASLQEVNETAFSRLFPGVRLTAAGIEGTVENYVADLFRQRESLDSPAVELLTRLDTVLSRCDCQVRSVSIDGDSAQLDLAAEARDQLDPVDGYRMEFIDSPPESHEGSQEESQVRLLLTREQTP